MKDNLNSLEKSIQFAIENVAGLTASRTGPFIVGYIESEGPEYPNELFRQYNRTLDSIEMDLSVSNAEQIRKQVWFLKEVDVLEEVTTDVLELDPEVERDDFDKRYYDTTEGVDTNWLEEDVRSVALALAGREPSSLLDALDQPEPADIPAEILNPQQSYYKQNNLDSAYLEQ
ncbi:hypothetical protein [Halorubrum sp. FL23]|uniref:hypothetical protein n=1 Tax=Halorubrum sp. FL23 TaxID=3458704 RepID=UPI0040342B59